MSQYLSLVAKSGQVNTPPGSYLTLKEWIINSFINQQSNVLEVGCSTGFITIEIARYTSASCTGVDLHEPSLEAARGNTDKDVEDKVCFLQADAGKLPFNDEQFSHVIVGGHLPFVSNKVREQHIAEAIRVVKPWGFVLTALYYYKETPPVQLLEKFNDEVGTSLTGEDYYYWDNLFKNQRLQIEYQSINNLILADSNRIDEYLDRLNPDCRNDWRRKLELFNENGKYLQYFVRVYRKLSSDSKIMLQIPRGGIYQVQTASVDHY